MCYKSLPHTIYLPLWLKRRSDDSVDLAFTLMLGKAVEKRNGVHRTSLEYPIGRWVQDPNWIPGSHDRCLHFASAYEVRDGRLNSYGSHRVLFLPSRHLYGQGDRSGFCWHDGATLPVLCLDCEGLEAPDLLREPEFWREALRLPPEEEFTVAPLIPVLQARGLPNPRRLWVARKRLPADLVYEWAR